VGAGPQNWEITCKIIVAVFGDAVCSLETLLVAFDFDGNVVDLSASWSRPPARVYLLK
jgi:hypothetical protein